MFFVFEIHKFNCRSKRFLENLKLTKYFFSIPCVVCTRLWTVCTYNCSSKRSSNKYNTFILSTSK